MLNFKDFVLGADTWEGSQDIDENTLYINGIRYLLIRINDTRGSDHKDEGFDAQWIQAKPFARGAYFVVAPWDTRAAQVAWLLQNLPADCKAVMLDVELTTATTDKHAYAQMVAGMIADLKAHGYKVLLYTGDWFKTSLDIWPTGVDYCWARYPSSVYPALTTHVTWDEIKAKLAQLSWSPGPAPAHVAAWQATADRYVMPGCANRALDLILMPIADFNRIFGDQLHAVLPTTPTPPQVTPGAPIGLATPQVLFSGHTTATNASGGLCVRSSPGVSATNYVLSLPFNSPVSVYQELNGFGRIDPVKQLWSSLGYIRKG
jgi:hypothetical protein